MNILILPYKEENFRYRSDGTLIRSIDDYFLPDYVKKIEISPVLCIKAFRPAKALDAQYVHRYINSFSFGLLIHPHLNDELEDNRIFLENSLDYTTLIPKDLIDLSELENFLGSISERFSIVRNNEQLFTELSSLSMEEIFSKIASITEYASLRIGDFILFELAQQKEVSIGDQISSFIEGKPSLELRIR